MAEFLIIQIKLGRTTLDAVKNKFGEDSGIYTAVAGAMGVS